MSVLAFSNSAVAKSCYEQSPNVANADDDYYNLDDTVKLSNDESNQLKTFFKRIRGNWKGEIVYSECRGPDRAPRIITKRATVTAKATLPSSQQVAINAQKHYTEARVKKPENFSLFNIKNIYAVAFPENNTLVFSERYRRTNSYVPTTKTASNKPTIKQAKKYKNAAEISAKTQLVKNRTSRITETIYEVTLNANSLTLLKSYYTNGVYTGEEKWLMRAN